MSKEIAERSKLWWAYCRRLRAVEDMSHGWGSNSQWRTSFRRDYRFGSELMFNVDGALDLGAPAPPSDPRLRELLEAFPLSRDDRVELLVNRCFVRTTSPDDDLWPYDDTLVVDEATDPRDGATWRLGPWR